MKVSVDIPYVLLKKATLEAENKEGICKVLPSGRFSILGNELGGSGEWRFSGIICDQLGGKSTGFGVKSCRNCLLTSEGSP